ncbi:hypothetical protein ACOMHN_028885 [Nucella lapillus]
MASQKWHHRNGVTEMASQKWRHRNGITEMASQKWQHFHSQRVSRADLRVPIPLMEKVEKELKSHRRGEGANSVPEWYGANSMAEWYGANSMAEWYGTNSMAEWYGANSVAEWYGANSMAEWHGANSVAEWYGANSMAEWYGANSVPTPWLSGMGPTTWLSAVELRHHTSPELRPGEVGCKHQLHQRFQSTDSPAADVPEQGAHDSSTKPGPVYAPTIEPQYTAAAATAASRSAGPARTASSNIPHSEWASCE